MTLEHFDALIAFIGVMLAASLVIVAGTQLIVGFLGLRGATLRRSLADLFESAWQDSDAKRYSKEIASRILRHPPISNSFLSRFSIRAESLPFVPAEAAGKLRWAAGEIPFQPWLTGALAGCFIWPATLAAVKYLIDADFCTYSVAVTHYVPLLDLCGHPWRSGAMLGAVVGGLLSRWRLSSIIRLEEIVPTLEKLSAPPGGTLPDPAQRTMLVMAGDTESQPRYKASEAAERSDKYSDDVPDEDDGWVAVAVEKSVGKKTEKKITPAAAEAKPRVENLNLHFDYAMERASQRFTVQARVVTVALSLALVFGAHLDAIRLFQNLFAGAQLRAQVSASAEAISKQADQFSHGKEGAASQAGARTSVPDVYRKALVAVLQPMPAAIQQPKVKARSSSHHAAASTSSSTQAQPGSDADVSVAQVAGESNSPSSPAAEAVPPSPAKKHSSKAAAAKAKLAAVEAEKSADAPLPGEDRVTIEAKDRAAKALSARPGFASREDAVSWLEATLDGDPAQGNIIAAYEQGVNAELVSDADKLFDHSASLQRELARSEVRLLPASWPGWKPAQHELPGLLVALAFLTLCAPLLYNLLKNIASLRPRPATK